MGHLLSYSLEVSLVSLLLYSVYRWLLSNENQPALNRAALLSIYAVALLLPALPHFSYWFSSGPGDIEFGTPEIAGVAHNGGETAGVSVSWLVGGSILLWLAGMLILMIQTVAVWFGIRRIVRSAECIRSGFPRVLITPDDTVSPFSCGHTMVMSAEDYRLNGDVIMMHESCHIARRHWIDLILSRIFIIFNWYNPAAWMMSDSLRDIHEYQADMAVLNGGVGVREYQMLLIKKAVGKSFPALANSLNHSKLKNRITMMLKTKSSKGRRMRALALAPAAVVALAVVNLPFVANALSSIDAAALFAGNKVNENPAASEIYSQQSVSVESVSNSVSESGSDEVLTMCEEMPEFEGGLEALYKWLGENIEYPADAPKGYGKTRVVLRFVVKSDGTIGDVEVLRGSMACFDQAAIKVVKSMPAWKPGKVSGKPVNVQYTLPVNFKEQ